MLNVAGVDRFERRQDDVRRHHGFSAAIEALPERRELQRLEPPAIESDDWQTQMAVDVGVPVPRKCLSVAMMPPSCAPSTYAATSAPTRAGSSPYDRVLITGLRGLLFTSATGAKFTCTPSARDSMPVMRASSRTRRSSPGGAHRHLTRKRRAADDSETDAGFEISRVEQRHGRQTLQAVDQKRRGQRLPQDDAAVRGFKRTGGAGCDAPNT